MRDCRVEMLRSIVIESYVIGGSIERQYICKNAKMYISYFLCKSCLSKCIYNICLSWKFFQWNKERSTPEKKFQFVSHNNKMEDEELKAIRAQRMAQMQGQAVSLIIIDFKKN